MEYIVIILAYTLPLWLGLIAVWFTRVFILREDSYARDWISGLIMLWASREFIRSFKFGRRR